MSSSKSTLITSSYHQPRKHFPSRFFFPIIGLTFSHFNLFFSVPWCLMVQNLSSPPCCSLYPLSYRCLPPYSTHLSSWWLVHAYLQLVFKLKLIRMGNKSVFQQMKSTFIFKNVFSGHDPSTHQSSQSSQWYQPAQAEHLLPLCPEDVLLYSEFERNIIYTKKRHP